ncbi:spore coat SP96 precursor protein [Fusarium heterosporum]|uniref:Spore coat SP96 protein n=1 Tax=Fusarium heterosporum TaxID=42747 RepID=A0A8H5T088_FUSHE|nr:spore coat SP96 precursor protein [Fusarium heterosporum]
MFAKAFAFASLASLASAHMLMANPKPYGNPNNSPLMDSGSDFPCKGVVNDGSSASNVYKQGSTQELSFTGQAVHGGGSCQISLTTDKNPTKDSVWKVIKSIEGGCPAKNTPGNLGENANAEDPYKYDFDIPEELAAGEYTLAWTWFNHVGNREMYMNCAAVEIQGSGGSKDYLESLPDMFVANIGNGCGTQNDKDLLFPNPGKNLDKFGVNEDAYATATGSCPTGSGSGGSPAPTGGNGSPAPTTNPVGQPTQAPAVPSSAPGDGSSDVPKIPGGGGAFITISQPAASKPSATQTPETPAAPEKSATPEAPATPQIPDDGSDQGSGSGSGNSAGETGSGSGGFAAGTACTSEGEWNCIGGTTFQRCASGAWTAAQQVSSGVTCTPGQSADIGMNAKRGKRTMRRSQRHGA